MEVATTVLSRREHFARVGSTNDVVRDWLASGTPEVCLAVADEQTAGRGRDGRTWLAPPGAALLLSLGFRPTWLAPDLVWRLPAVVSLAMADAAEAAIGAAAGTVRLKWPNDLMIDGRKVAGVLGESVGLGTDDPRVIVGIGINVNWPADVTEGLPIDVALGATAANLVSGREVDRDAVLTSLLDHLAVQIGSWTAVASAYRRACVTIGRAVRIELPDETFTGTAADVSDDGHLLVDIGMCLRTVTAGDVVHLRPI